MSEVEAVTGTHTWLVQKTLWAPKDLEWLTWVAVLEQSLAWYQSKLLTGWTLRRRGDHWVMVLKALERNNSREGKPVVAFMQARTPLDCFKALGGAIRTNGLYWKDDKYA